MDIILGTIAIIFGFSFLVFLGNVFYYWVYFAFNPLEEPSKKNVPTSRKNITIQDLKITVFPYVPFGKGEEKAKEGKIGKLAPKCKPFTKRNSKE